MLNIITVVLILFFTSQAYAESYDSGLIAYEQGNYRRASEIWAKLADRGDRPSQYAMAVCHLNGYYEFPKDPKIASKYFALLAKSPGIDSYLWNKPRQQVFLGNMYQNGTYLPKDFKEAVRWYQKASSKSYAPAQYYLAKSYIKGRGLNKDLDRAFNLMSQSALQGHGRAQEALGQMYFKGQGIKKNIVYAKVWINIAEANEQKSKLAPIVNQNLTPLQKSRIPSLTRACIFGIHANYITACKPIEPQWADLLQFKNLSLQKEPI